MVIGALAASALILQCDRALLTRRGISATCINDNIATWSDFCYDVLRSTLPEHDIAILHLVRLALLVVLASRFHF